MLSLGTSINCLCASRPCIFHAFNFLGGLLFIYLLFVPFSLSVLFCELCVFLFFRLTQSTNKLNENIPKSTSPKHESKEPKIVAGNSNKSVGNLEL